MKLDAEDIANLMHAYSNYKYKGKRVVSGTSTPSHKQLQDAGLIEKVPERGYLIVTEKGLALAYEILDYGRAERFRNTIKSLRNQYNRETIDWILEELR